MNRLNTIFFLTQRLFLIKFRDKMDIFNIIFVPMIIGLSTAFVLKYTETSNELYSFSTNSKFVNFLFLSVIIVIFIALTNSVREIIANKIYIIKEKRSGVSNIEYFLSTLIVLLVIVFIQVTLYVVTSSYIIELHDSFREFFIWLYLAGIAATSFGLFVSSVVNSEVGATMAVPLILIPQIILGGGMIKYQEINKHIFIKNISTKDKNRAIPVISQVMISKWATEGLYVGLYESLEKIREQIDAPRKFYDNQIKKLMEEYAKYATNKSYTKAMKEKKKAYTKQKYDELTAKKALLPLSNMYINTTLHDSVSGGENDFLEPFVKNDNCLNNILSFIKSNSIVSNIPCTKDLNESIINTFSSPVKYYFGYMLKTTFINKIVILLYSFIFLVMSFLMLRRI